MNDERQDFEHRWERLLHEELRGLPDSEAPADLISNVMTIIRAEQTLRTRAWYRRPFLLWPRALQFASGAGAIAVFALLAWNASALWAQLPGWPEPPALVARGIDEFSALVAAARALFDALALAATTFFTPARTAICAAIIISQVALLGVGASVWRNLFVPRSRTIRDELLPFQS